MIYCPEFNLQPRLYDTVLPWLSIVALLVNPYAIYCIIWRSTSHMKTYRWFLLYHQVFAFITDISVSYLVKPVMLIPLPIGYPTGLLRRILPTKIIVAALIFVACLSFGSILHLFGYRYEVAKGTKRLFPFYIVCIMIGGYSGCLIAPFAMLIADQKHLDVIEMLRNTYSCVTAEILFIEDALFYRYSSVIFFGVLPLISLSILFVIVDLAILFLSYKETHTRVMSQKLKKIQRRFLLQLTIQSFIPLILVSIPLLSAIIAVIFGIFGTAFLADLVLLAFAAFGSIGGIVLVAMNPTYYNWIYHLSSKQMQIAPISSFTPKPGQDLNLKRSNSNAKR